MIPETRAAPVGQPSFLIRVSHGPHKAVVRLALYSFHGLAGLYYASVTSDRMMTGSGGGWPRAGAGRSAALEEDEAGLLDGDDGQGVDDEEAEEGQSQGEGGEGRELEEVVEWRCELER